MGPYGLRQTIRCPVKYGETTTKRNYKLVSQYTESEAESQRPLDERYVKNAAVLPNLHSPSSDRDMPQEQSSPSSAMPEPLMIHGFTIPEYKTTYHSVVDPLLLTSCGKLMPYSLKLGRTLKEHLFKELAYPTLEILEQPNGKLEMTERFCILRPTPFIDLDKISKSSLN